MIRTTRVCFSVESYLQGNYFLNESDFQDVTENALKLLKGKRILKTRLQRNWCEYTGSGHQISQQELLKLREEVGKMKEEMLAKVRSSKPVLGIRQRNKTIDLSDLFDLSQKIVVSKKKFDIFFGSQLKKMKRIGKVYRSSKILKLLSVEPMERLLQRFRRKKIEQNLKKLGTLLRTYEKLSKQIRLHVGSIESVNSFLNANTSLNRNQHQIWKSYRDMTPRRLSFYSFRSICNLLDFRYLPIFKIYRETEEIKEGRIRMLIRIIQLKQTKPSTVFFFDCTSFNWNQKTQFCWFKKSQPVAFPPITDFRAVHLLMMISFDKVIAFQLISGKLSSDLICSFLLQVLEKEKQMFENKEVNIILDNARMHRTDLMKKLACYKNITFNFIIPRNPFFNIIEFAFRFIKTRKPSTFPFKK